jgi:hypothetical protein
MVWLFDEYFLRTLTKTKRNKGQPLSVPIYICMIERGWRRAENDPGK